jgi:uroporphyrin-III C-methyltransferase/precorrin-2 dehydrogenase/sirohydrochlorin ferrochelatase
MGLVGLKYICERLIQEGMPSTTPAAVVQQGTTQRQRVVTATIADLAEKVEAAKIKAPSLTIIGEVVQLREKLNWFEPNAAEH